VSNPVNSAIVVLSPRPNNHSHRKLFIMTMTKFVDSIRGVNAKLAELQATTANLSLAEKQALLESLSKDVQAAAAKADGPKRRLDAIKAAAVSSNKRTSGAYKAATSGLEKLGYSLDQIAASGSTADVEAAMRQRKWTTNQQIGLKLALGIVGAI
jgi:hypothetical protein